VVITCESGQASYESFCFNKADEEKGLLNVCEITVTYAESENVYKIITKSYMAQTSEGNVQKRREVELTGGVFGDETQYCQNY